MLKAIEPCRTSRRRGVFKREGSASGEKERKSQEIMRVNKILGRSFNVKKSRNMIPYSTGNFQGICMNNLNYNNNPTGSYCYPSPTDKET